MTEPLNNTRHLTASSPLAMDITAENLLQIGQLPSGSADPTEVRPRNPDLRG